MKSSEVQREHKLLFLNISRKNKLRSPGTTSVCISALTANYEFRKPEFKIKRRG